MSKKKKSKRALSRRTFLANASAVIALPLLDIMEPEIVYGQTGQPMRVFSILVPNGLAHDKGHNYWIPPAAGNLPNSLPYYLRNLYQVRDSFSVVSNLQNIFSGFVINGEDQGPGSHARATSSYFTASKAKKTSVERDVRCGVSFDQIIARHVNGKVAHPSIALTTKFRGDIDGAFNYHSSYSYFSWLNPTLPNTNVVEIPRILYNRLFRDLTGSSTQNLSRRSILDLLISETNSLSAKLGGQDKAKLDEYMTGIREIEKKIQTTTVSTPSPTCTAPAAPGYNHDFAKFSENRSVFFDLVAKAFECDLSRVVVMAYDHEGTGRTLPGTTETWHDNSHYTSGNPTQRALNYDKININMIDSLGEIIQKFKQTSSGGKSLFDSSIITLGSALASGAVHSSNPLPFFMAGKGNGLHRPGQHFQLQPNTPLANVWLSLIRGMGINQSAFGNSTGVINFK